MTTTPTIFAKPPPMRPDLKSRLHIELAERAVDSRIVVTPGPDDWFGETDVSRFVTYLEVEAKVGETTHVGLDCVMVEVTDGASHSPLAGAFTQPRFWRLRRRWFGFRVRKVRRIQLTRGAA